MNNIKTQVLNNEIMKKVLDSIEDKNEKEKTLKVIEGLLEELQGKANSLTAVYEDIKNKQKNS